MAIKRVTDLSSILNNGPKDGAQQVISIEEGIKRDVLGNSQGVGHETNQLKKSNFEVSWPTTDDASPSKFESRNMDYATLSGYITHNILDEDYTFNGGKDLNGILSVNGDLSVTNATNIRLQSDKEINVYAKDGIDLRTETSAYMGWGEANIACRKTGTNSDKNDVHIHAEDNVHLSSDVAYIDIKSSFEIRGINTTGEPTTILQITWNPTTKKATISFPKSTAQNPISGYINHSLWS